MNSNDCIVKKMVYYREGIIGRVTKIHKTYLLINNVALLCHAPFLLAFLMDSNMETEEGAMHT